MTTKQIVVLSTLINGRENFVASPCTKHGMFHNKYNVHHTTDLHAYAKEFASLREAEEFIPQLHNPHSRVYAAVTKTIEFKTREERNDYERIL